MSSENLKNMNPLISQGNLRKPYTNGNGKKVTYAHCGLNDHIIDKCHKKHGYHHIIKLGQEIILM